MELPIRKIGLWVVGLFVLVQISFPARSQPVIVIDPGHGAVDSGAVGRNGLKEKEVVLQLAQEILKLGEARGILDIYLTRDKDTLVSLWDRTRLAQTLKADLFLSLHCNHAENPTARGAEIFVALPPIPAYENNLKESMFLARELIVGMNENLGFHSRGVKFANFQVLRESIAFSPAILVELGFMSNGDEAEHFSQKPNLEILAFLIVETLTKYFKL